MFVQNTEHCISYVVLREEQIRITAALQILLCKHFLYLSKLSKQCLTVRCRIEGIDRWPERRSLENVEHSFHRIDSEVAFSCYSHFGK